MMSLNHIVLSLDLVVIRRGNETTAGAPATSDNSGFADDFPRIEECMCGKKFHDEVELQTHQVSVLFFVGWI